MYSRKLSYQVYQVYVQVYSPKLPYQVNVHTKTPLSSLCTGVYIQKLPYQVYIRVYTLEP